MPGPGPAMMGAHDSFSDRGEGLFSTGISAGFAGGRMAGAARHGGGGTSCLHHPEGDIHVHVLVGGQLPAPKVIATARRCSMGARGVGHLQPGLRRGE